MGFIRINNRNNFLLKNIPVIHPQTLKYKKFWRKHKKRCIEGFWGIDDDKYKVNDLTEFDPYDNNYKGDKYRFLTPQYYFYVNFGTILHKPAGSPKTVPKKPIKPLLRDIEWEFGYNWFEAIGFSGFENDEVYSCNRLLTVEKYTDDDLKKMCLDENSNIIIQFYNNLFKSDGSRKEYITARKYLRQLFDKPMGVPLYWNNALNLFVLGSRGFGKSFQAAIPVMLHEFLFDGAKYYNEESIKHPYLVEIVIGAAVSTKSAETLKKFKTALDKLPGAYSDKKRHTPSPFFKHTSGTLNPGKKPFEHLYEKKVGGEWIPTGTGTNLQHVVYTIDKPDAAVGTRPGKMVIEEVGLLSNLLAVVGANDTCQKEGTEKFGSALYIGTGGSMEKTIEAEIIFRDPDGYDLVPFDDEWENSGKIGWFVPAQYALNQFKDSNGNTDFDKATEFLEAERTVKKKAKHSAALHNEKVYRPVVPSEMFLSTKVSPYPVEDIKVKLTKLLTDNKILNSSYKGYFDLLDNKVSWRNTTDSPIREFPYKGEDKTGCVEIYQLPRKLDGYIPSNRYIAALDPVDDDGNKGEGLSLQSFFILDTFTEEIVLEYTARTRRVKQYYEQVRRALLFYNARLLYENQKKGIFAHFNNKNTLFLLADTPKMLQDMDMQKPGEGNKRKGVYATEKINQWGREELGPEWLEKEINHNTTALDKIRSVGLLREMIAYDSDINTDRIASFGLLMIYREVTLKTHNKRKAEQVNRLSQHEFFDKHFKGKSQNAIEFSDKFGFVKTNE